MCRTLTDGSSEFYSQPQKLGVFVLIILTFVVVNVDVLVGRVVGVVIDVCDLNGEGGSRGQTQGRLLPVTPHILHSDWEVVKLLFLSVKRYLWPDDGNSFSIISSFKKNETDIWKSTSPTSIKDILCMYMHNQSKPNSPLYENSTF